MQLEEGYVQTLIQYSSGTKHTFHSVYSSSSPIFTFPNVILRQLIHHSLHCCLEAAFLQFALPDDDDVPAHRFKLGIMLLVIGDVPVKFLLPEIRVGPRSRRILAERMPVPEAAVDKDGCSVFLQDDVRLAGERGNVLPVAETVPEKILPHLNFYGSVFPFNAAHVPTAVF